MPAVAANSSARVLAGPMERIAAVELPQQHGLVYDFFEYASWLSHAARAHQAAGMNFENAKAVKEGLIDQIGKQGSDRERA